MTNFICRVDDELQSKMSSTIKNWVEGKQILSKQLEDFH